MRHQPRRPVLIICSISEGEQGLTDKDNDRHSSYLYRDCTRILYQMATDGKCKCVGFDYVWDNGDEGRELANEFDPDRKLLIVPAPRTLSWPIPGARPDTTRAKLAAE